MNTLGIVCALASFIGIWLGHVAVRYIEARVAALRVPVVIFGAAGLVLLGGSLLASSRVLSASLGIVGMTVVWDALEFFRQEKRIIRGHAPANPLNPRHQRILEKYPSASSVEWLKREPQGRPLTEAELNAIREGSR